MFVLRSQLIKMRPSVQVMINQTRWSSFAHATILKRLPRGTAGALPPAPAAGCRPAVSTARVPALHIGYQTSCRRCAPAAAAARKPPSSSRGDSKNTSSSQDAMSDADFDALLADGSFLSNLRTQLRQEMADEDQTADPPRRGPFDSDEYDMDALDSEDAATAAKSRPADDVARASAARLAAASEAIANKHRSRDAKPQSTSSSGATDNRRSGSPATSKQQQRARRPAPQPEDDADDEAEVDGDSAPAAKGGKKSRASSPRGAVSKGAGSDYELPRGIKVPQVVLKKYKARLFEAGSPLVYGGAVECVIGRPPPERGDVVLVVDSDRSPIAWGVFNPDSMFRVRIMQHRSEWLEDDSAFCDVPALLSLRIQQAVALRGSLGLPSSQTDVFRLINNEGDRLSGVSADQIGQVVVVQSAAAWSERYRAEITAAILEHTGSHEVVWRPQTSILKEEGLQVAADNTNTSSSTPQEALGEAEAAEEGEEEEEEAAGPSSPAAANGSGSGGSGDDTVAVVESGVKHLASPRTGQKTGYYADQRDSRSFIRSVAGGKTLLDLCCYSGGFAVSAAVGGALAVTGVDSSSAAIQLACSNAELNGVADRATFVREDITPFLKAAVEAGSSWDIVVLDPPKLAPNKRALTRATIKYKQLNQLALSVVRRGGLLMTCSCSGAMTQSGELPRVVQEAAVRAGRQVTLIRQAAAAPDHPLHPCYPEGAYLTNLTYRVL